MERSSFPPPPHSSHYLRRVGFCLSVGPAWVEPGPRESGPQEKRCGAVGHSGHLAAQWESDSTHPDRETQRGPRVKEWLCPVRPLWARWRFPWRIDIIPQAEHMNEWMMCVRGVGVWFKKSFKRGFNGASKTRCQPYQKQSTMGANIIKTTWITRREAHRAVNSSPRCSLNLTHKTSTVVLSFFSLLLRARSTQMDILA